jgi:hypothetical protein
MDWAFGVRFPAEARDFSLHVVQSGSGTSLDKYTSVNGGRIRVENDAGRKAGHLPLSSVEVRNG